MGSLSFASGLFPWSVPPPHPCHCGCCCWGGRAGPPTGVRQGRLLATCQQPGVWLGFSAHMLWDQGKPSSRAVNLGCVTDVSPLWSGRGRPPHSHGMKPWRSAINACIKVLALAIPWATSQLHWCWGLQEDSRICFGEAEWVRLGRHGREPFRYMPEDSTRGKGVFLAKRLHVSR